MCVCPTLCIGLVQRRQLAIATLACLSQQWLAFVFDFFIVTFFSLLNLTFLRFKQFLFWSFPFHYLCMRALGNRRIPADVIVYFFAHAHTRTVRNTKDSCDVMELLCSRKMVDRWPKRPQSPFRGSRTYFKDFSWGIHNIFKWTAYRKPYWKCLVKYSAHFVALCLLLNNVM